MGPAGDGGGESARVQRPVPRGLGAVFDRLGTTLARTPDPARRRAERVGRTLLAAASSLAVIALMIAALGADPWTAFVALIDGALGNKFGLADTLIFGAVLILTGLAAAIPFSAGMWNIGGEGQLIAGGIAAAAVAFEAPATLPSWGTASLAILAALAGGALWGLVPGYLKARWGANEVIVTLMFVFIAFFLAEYAISTLWPSESHTTLPIPAGELPVLWASTSLNAGVLLGVVAVVVAWFLMARTSLGFQIKATGHNLHAARISGVRSGRTRILAMSIGGAFAGAAGGILVIGVNTALVGGFSANLGFLGIAVALMAGLSPIWILGSAFLFSILRAGSDNMQVVSGLDPAVGDMVVATLVITLLAFRVVRVRQLGSLNE